MNKEITVYLQDILVCIAKIDEYTKNITENNFHENTQLQDSVLRKLEIIGEAVKKIPQDFRINIQKYHGDKLQG